MKISKIISTQESSALSSAFSLQYLLLRLKALRPVVRQPMSSQTRANTLEFRDGRLPDNICQLDGELTGAGSYDVLSDDEDIVLSTGGSIEFNSYIWRRKMSAAVRKLASDFSRIFLGRASTAAPLFQSRPLMISTALHDSIRDAHRAGTKVSGAAKEVMEGTAGAGRFTTVSMHGIESRFPTAETMKTEFDGIPYCDLPIVYIKATKNNTLVTVMDKNNHVIIYTSCRLEGFKHARKKTTIAGQTTGVAAGQRLVRRGVRAVRVQVKGLGPGRMTCVKGLTVSGVQVVSITDHTALKELGPRPRKIRRV
ncbi:ribosomal protein S11 [Necator americanus]|uniref:Ribosomal protein S11 n=1 Tax=Necator americanus TaxID=51031 RepID=W2TLW8_NECAM|nr:ribosomal protein S11 [Necator americanus]ETN82131.1 ribosomal protein S11 [Necator americanus]